MAERDWTNSDQADAADAEYDRKWWRCDSSLAPWPDEEDEDPLSADGALAPGVDSSVGTQS